MKLPGFLWLRGGCAHASVRCTHGDEIIARNFKRVVCLDCGKALDWPLPTICWHTGEPHPSVVDDLANQGYRIAHSDG